MGKKTTVQAPAPDPNIGLSAAAAADLGRDWFNESRNQFGVANVRQDRADALTNEVVQDQLAASRTAQQWAAEDRARYRSVFQPAQDRFIEKANGWDSPERQAEAAREARADVMSAAEAQRGTTQRQAAAMGISPTSGRYAGVERAGEAATAIAAAGAENTARSRVRREAVALQADAVNMGNGLAVNPGQSLGLGVQAGSAAVGNTTTNNAAARGNLGILESGYRTAMGGLQSQAGILGQQYGQTISAWNAGQQRAGQETAGLYGAIGSAVGIGAGMFMRSSKDAKKDKRPARGALEAVMNMPVEEWTYKEGVGDGERHIGPYAEDFKRETGMGDGKTINVIDAIGINMRATQELAEEVREMRGALSSKPKPKGRGVMREAA
ncbi:tail fiber domain-containing protein [Sediminicoccus rosea]|uniref:Tail fiber domain-containing protein n=1 Tax=Sediminicoccus rosea TaxID=1225128 RepID=A0ABZ0PP83_9PROT|nr:tail fiber domain-containing protein [Sediminicoccus rosea]WPB86920.1 tail fiber domain-containing protein [Sediminicoccus rosea]